MTSYNGSTLGYVTTDDQGQPLLLRDNHIASSVYSFNTAYLTSNPKNKFSYFIRFVKTNNNATMKTAGASSSILGKSNPLQQLGNIATTALDLSGNTQLGADVSLGTNILSTVFGNSSTSNSSGTSTTNWQEVLGFYAKSCDRPKINFKTRTINQYNKKRVVQTGHSFSPISISFNDTADGAAEAMFREYYSFYYGDGKNTSSAAWASDMTAATMLQGAGGWGFRAPSVTNAEMSYFFDTIQIYTFYNGYFDRYDLVNPKITNYSPDSLDYSDGSGLLSIRLTFEYEGLVYAQTRQKVLNNQSLISTWGFDRGSYYYPSDTYTNATAATFAPTVSFNNPVADNSYSSSDQLFSISGLASIASEFLGGNSTSLHSYNSIFPPTSMIGSIIDQNRGTISQMTGNVTNPTERALANISGIL